MLMNWKIWVPFQFLNFRFIPLNLQVGPVQLTLAGWQALPMTDSRGWISECSQLCSGLLLALSPSRSPVSGTAMWCASSRGSLWALNPKP